MPIFDNPGEEVPWGTDGPISLPNPKEDIDANAADVGGGFIFTPSGMRYDLTKIDRDALYSAPYAPPQGT